MALSPGVVERDNETGGQAFRVFELGGIRYQGIVISDANGLHQGVTGNPLVTSVTGTVTTTVSGTVATTVSGTVATTVSGVVNINDTVPIDVNVVSGGGSETFSRYSSPTYADNLLIAGAAQLRQLRVIMKPSVTSVRYLMLWDSNTISGKAGTAPQWRIVVPVAGEASESFNVGEFVLTSGLVAMMSSTPETLTVTTGLEALLQVVRAV